jgi:hypothetical protein
MPFRPFISIWNSTQTTAMRGLTHDLNVRRARNTPDALGALPDHPTSYREWLHLAFYETHGPGSGIRFLIDFMLFFLLLFGFFVTISGEIEVILVVFIFSVVWDRPIGLRTHLVYPLSRRQSAILTYLCVVLEAVLYFGLPALLVLILHYADLPPIRIHASLTIHPNLHAEVFRTLLVSMVFAPLIQGVRRYLGPGGGLAIGVYMCSIIAILIVHAFMAKRIAAVVTPMELPFFLLAIVVTQTAFYHYVRRRHARREPRPLC